MKADCVNMDLCSLHQIKCQAFSGTPSTIESKGLQQPFDIFFHAKFVFKQMGMGE